MFISYIFIATILTKNCLYLSILLFGVDSSFNLIILNYVRKQDMYYETNVVAFMFYNNPKKNWKRNDIYIVNNKK